MDLFFNVLSKNGLEPVIIGNTLYVKKLSDNKKFYSIDLFFELPDSIVKAITSNYPEIKVSSIQKTIAFKTDSKTYGEICTLVDFLDRPRPQRKLKVIMVSYNDSDLKEYGVKLAATQKNSTETASFTSLINSLTLGNVVHFTNGSSDLSLSFSALDTLGFVKVHLDNIISLSDGKSSTLTNVKTIPVLTAANSVNSTQTVANNTYQYKDIGTSINISSVTITSDALYFDTNMTFEELLTDSSTTPITSKKSFSNYLRLSSGDSVLISGIKSIDDEHKDVKIPILSNIPYLGALFQYKTKTYKNETFAIYLENVAFDDKNVSVGLVQ